MMNVVLFGATGMVGSGVLLECLDDPRVASVLVVGRRSCGVTHRKLTEVLHDDFFDYSALGARLSGLDACFFCLGVSAAGMKEAEYTRLTHDLTLAAARALLDRNPDMVFCYVSGLGTDSTESGRAMWARVKGRTENALRAMPFRGAYMFRPGFIQPLRGVRSRTRLYAALYRVAGPLFPLLRRLFPRQVTTSVRVGRAMIRVAAEGHASPILESDVIDGLGAQ